MSLRAIAAVVAAAINLCLAVLAISRNRRVTLYRTFGFTSFCLFIWNFFYVFQANLEVRYDLFGRTLAGVPADLVPRLLLWQRLNSVGLVLLPAAVFHFALSLTERKDRLTRSILRAAYVLSFAFLASLITPLFTSFHNLYWSRAYASFLIPLTVYSFYLIFQRYRASDSALEKNRLRYLLSGGVIAIGGGITNLAPVFGISILPLGNISNSLYAIIVAVAIIRHRLLDIQVVFNRILSFVIMVLSFSAIFLLFIFLVGKSVHMVYWGVLLVASLILLIYQPLREKVHLLTDRLVLKGKYNYQTTLRELGTAMTTLTDGDELIPLFVDSVAKSMRVASAWLAIADERRQACTVVYSWGMGTEPHQATLRSAGSLIEPLLREGKPLVKEELERELGFANLEPERRMEVEQLVNILERAGAEVAIPLRARSGLIGILYLGPREENKVYTTADLELLAFLSNEAALALENIRMWEDVSRADRLRALGEMAASVAHEVRNPLAAIRSSAQSLQSGAQDSELPGIIVEEVDRLNGLVSEFLDFSRPLEPRLEPHHIVETVEGALDLLKKQDSLQNVEVVKTFGRDLPLVLTDPDQMKQVFINLFLNAVQAMPSGGTLTIGASAQDEQLEIEVKDTGSGIGQEELKRMFEPFFTTKERGAGLGLSIVQRIVEAHKGTISARSTVGKGTTITLSLPIQAWLHEDGASCLS